MNDGTGLFRAGLVTGPRGGGGIKFGVLVVMGWKFAIPGLPVTPAEAAAACAALA